MGNLIASTSTGARFEGERGHTDYALVVRAQHFASGISRGLYAVRLARAARRVTLKSHRRRQRRVALFFVGFVLYLRPLLDDVWTRRADWSVGVQVRGSPSRISSTCRLLLIV